MIAWSQTGLAAQPFHTVATSADGRTIVAGSIPGTVSVSRDGGTTWSTPTGTPSGDLWISVDVSANGQHMAAVGFGGGLYVSHDSGATFTRSDAVIAAAEGASPAYEGVTISDDGQRIVATVQNGRVYYSANGGTTFAASTGAPVSPWRSVDSSASGLAVVAINHNGEVYSSTNGGVSFTVLPVTVGGAAIADGWYRVAMSRDGTTIALAGNQQWGAGGPTTGIYVGRLAAGSWTFNQGSAVSGNYGAIAMSADGSIIAASLYTPTAAGGAPAQILYSSNGGVSFRGATAPTASPANWRGLAMNALGTRFVLANGDFATAASGQLYTGQ